MADEFDLFSGVADASEEDPVPEVVARSIQDELGSSSPDTAICPECGGSLVASRDSGSLLSFPMIFVWKCGSCDYSERRTEEG